MARIKATHGSRVAVAAQDKVYALAARTPVLGFPMAAYVGWMLYAHGFHVAAFLTTAFIEVTLLAAFLLARHYNRKRAQGWAPHGYWWPGMLIEPLAMLAWALPAMCVTGAEEPMLRPMLVAFLTGIGAAVTVESAVAPMRHRIQIAVLFGVPTLSLLVNPAEDGFHLAIATTSFAILMLALAHELRDRFERRLQLETEKETLVDTLRHEQERAEAANRELTEALQQLGYQSTHDHLTGLISRGLFLDLLTSAIRRTNAHERRTGVLYFDLDGFKVVNDSFGHGAGDALLVQIGARLQQDLRAGAVLARLGGDEFAVMIEDITEPEALVAANRMANVLSIPVDVHGRPITMTVSVGVALSDSGVESGIDLLRNADLAMYRAKEEGRNRIEVFDVSMRAVVDREAEELQEFRQALLGGAIVAWYQPEVDLVTGRTVECEALARWDHPTRGVLPAGAFIDMAYATGLADDVTAAVAASSLRFLRDSRGDLPPDFRLRVNLTPRSVGSANNTHRFLASVRAHGISPELLTVEVTEQAVIRDIDSATANLNTLRDAGIRVSLDDFGTGYSSLSLLRKLPFDSIKMDRSFVGGMLTNSADLAIVRTTIDLARQLEMEVVAEGVENQEQAELLLSLGCVRAQGYLYAPALSPERFLERVCTEREALATYGTAALTLEPVTKAGAA